MPQVRQIEIPAAIHFLHRQLESGLAVEIGNREPRCCGRNILVGSAEPWLAAYRNAVFSAIPFHGTLAAKRRDRPAEMLAEAYQEIIVFDPVLFWEFLWSANSVFSGVAVFMPQRLEIRCTCVSTQIPGLR